jgi:NADH-quinone oxidoreductase subunit L
MNLSLPTILLLIPLLPLGGALLAGLFRNQVGRVGSHSLTILAVALSFVLSAWLLLQQINGSLDTVNISIYTWMVADGIRFEIGFLIDHLTTLMMCVVTFVSLMVHIYTIGYMRDDPGYQRFFSYIALFTFSMLMLVMSNNFLQLFFGWEAVGLVSYLLIGFWFNKESAINAGLKAFLVNRVGDFGFLLGIAAVLLTFGTLDYAEVFARAGNVVDVTLSVPGGLEWNMLTFICVCLFIGAMGKSAQAPLHVWLPDSMEGPTPISALIHAATMVTAGIFMVARMSPLFEFSDAALSFVMLTGAVTALSMGLIGIVQNDVKRVIAYSTLSQLGYMTVALGASAYSAAIFHLMTHAFFKALLFLGAGSVIIALHHEQDVRHMGGLRKYMPVTWLTAWIGTLALVGFPFSAGFYSKDAIIEALAESHRFGSGFAYIAVVAGVLVTAIYSFRLLYLTFHGKERFEVVNGSDGHLPSGQLAHVPRESPLVVTIPLILLAIPSIFIGWLTIEPVLFGGWLQDSIFVLDKNDVLTALGEHFNGATAMAMHAVYTLPFWLMMTGMGLSTLIYLFRPSIADTIRTRMRFVYRLLDNKYYFDEFYQKYFAQGSVRLGRNLWHKADAGLIDNGIVNGSARVVEWVAAHVRSWQTGFLYDYAFAMIIGLISILAVWVTMVPEG